MSHTNTPITLSENPTIETRDVVHERVARQLAELRKDIKPTQTNDTLKTPSVLG